MRKRTARRAGPKALVGFCSLAIAAAVGASSACVGLGDAPPVGGALGAGGNHAEACPTEGARKTCGAVVGRNGDQVVCGFGESVCSGGAWDDCSVGGPVTLAPRADAAGYQLESLGASAACGDDSSCDPNCFQFKDTGGGVGSNDSGVVEGDGGLTLNSSDGGAQQVGQCAGGVMGTCAHSLCTVGAGLVSGCDQPTVTCVSKVCATHPECCSQGWSAACVGYLPALCNVTCAADTNGQCVLCYQDAVDHDGDGYSFAQGDCQDCDATINPGAYDVPGNGIDENCDGTPDNETPVCDGALAMSSANPFDHAKAIGLCPKADPAATGAAKKWGVLDAKLVQANGSSAPSSLSYGILTQFGANNLPQQGTQMAVFSSGTARAPGSPGYVNPTSSYNQGTACSYPTGFPKNAAGCPNGGGTANDSSGLRLEIRVPTNAKSFSYNFDFFSAEYPEWVCTSYNDGYVALLQSAFQPPNPPAHSNNITFDSKGNPVSVNIGFFGVPGCPTCSSAKLTSTGFDGKCWGQTCGGATDWLQTNAPVVPGETITIQFSIWDTGDHVYDSTVLLDNWLWSPTPSQIVTQPPTPPSPPKYTAGTFVRDFNAVCPAGTHLTWGLYIWTATTPGDSSIVFTAQTADTAAALPAAAPLALATALAQNNSTAFAPLSGLPGGASKSWLRVTAALNPTSDALQAPVLSAWTAQYDCVPAQ